MNTISSATTAQALLSSSLMIGHIGRSSQGISSGNVASVSTDSTTLGEVKSSSNIGSTGNDKSSTEEGYYIVTALGKSYGTLVSSPMSVEDFEKGLKNPNGFAYDEKYHLSDIINKAINSPGQSNSYKNGSSTTDSNQDDLEIAMKLMDDAVKAARSAKGSDATYSNPSDKPSNSSSSDALSSTIEDAKSVSSGHAGTAVMRSDDGAVTVTVTFVQGSPPPVDVSV